MGSDGIEWALWALWARRCVDGASTVRRPTTHDDATIGETPRARGARDKNRLHRVERAMGLCDAVVGAFGRRRGDAPATVMTRGDDDDERRPVVRSLDDVVVQRDVLKNGGDYGSIARERREATTPLARDVNTRDHWVARHPGVVVVEATTGRASEPPTTRLMRCGAVTPAEVHFVHNIGAVPRCEWETHTLTIEVDDARRRRRTYSLDALTRAPSRTLACAVARAGNRSKEAHAVREIDGARWGPGAVGNSLWTGVPLRALLVERGVTEPTPTRRFVRFEGVRGESDDADAPAPCVYMPLHVALDPAADVLVCYAQNGERLLPDQGFPLRLVAPGAVDESATKHLTSIRVTAHAHNDEDTTRPLDRAFTELCVNSAVTSPAHDEYVPLDAERYEIKGYAYAGGGRAVSRVEITLDDGRTWLETTLRRPCPPSTHGKHWGWTLWSYAAPTRALAAARSLKSRAFDDAGNAQPSALAWTPSGERNNCEYVVKLSLAVTRANGTTYVACEHPIEPGAGAGGWMMRDDDDDEDESVDTSEVRVKIMESAQRVVKSTTKTPPPPTTTTTVPPPPPPVERKKDVKYFTAEEVERHNAEDDCWIIVKGKVYDVNAYLRESAHPGGNASITMNAGEDVTEDFEAVHSTKAWKQLEAYYIGELGTAADAAASAATIDVESDAKDDVIVVEEPKRAFPKMPARGPVHLVKFYEEHAEAYGAPLLGEAAEAAAFDRMWAGAKNIVPEDAPLGLNPKKWMQLKIKNKVPLSHDSILLRFELESDAHQCGMPVGYHVYLRGEWNGKKVMRAYTPSSLNGTLGAIELVIKIYYSDAHEAYPEGGALTQYLHHLNEGDLVDVKGPVGHIHYLGNGNFTIDKKPLPRATKMTLLGGGTGVAPMLQLIVAALADASDETELSFIYANKTEDDVLLMYTLDRLEREHPTRFRVHYMISKETWAKERKTGPEWSSDRVEYGRVSLPVIRARGFPANGTSHIAVMCGPPAFEEDTCVPALLELGYPKEAIIRY